MNTFRLPEPNGNWLEVEVMTEKHGCARNAVLGERQIRSDDARVMREQNGEKK